MGKGARARQARRAARGDNPWRKQMIEAYARTFQWAQEKPDLAADLAAISEQDAGMWLDLLGESPDVDFARKTAEMVRRWAILNEIVWLSDWPKPVSVMSDDEIIAATRRERA